MLVLRFHVGGERYALPCRRIVEVAPRVRLRAMARAPAFVAGLMIYRGAAVPVIDLGQLFAGVACAERMSTRILVVSTRRSGIVGLLAERVSEAAPLDEESVERSPIRLAGAEYLGGVFRDGEGLVQLVEPENLLPERVVALLAEEERGQSR